MIIRWIDDISTAVGVWTYNNGQWSILWEDDNDNIDYDFMTGLSFSQILEDDLKYGRNKQQIYIEEL